MGISGEPNWLASTVVYTRCCGQHDTKPWAGTQEVWVFRGTHTSTQLFDLKARESKNKTNLVIVDMKATQEQMHDARLDLAFRDHCAHLLIPLNECRRDTMYLPWKCEHERHAYEKCQYLE